MSHGEECVLFHMHHVNEAVKDGVPRCPDCWDAVYKQGDRFDCPNCFGTSFEGGVQSFYRAWALFTDSQDEEDVTKRGFWHPIARSMHTEWMPDLWQRDYVARISEWSVDHRVLEVEGVYVCKEVANESLRTGNAFGQTSRDATSQRADLTRIAEEMPIYQYALIGQKVDRFDGKVR